MSDPISSQDVKAAAKRIGFDLAAITTAEPFPKHLKAVRERRASGKIPEALGPLYPAIGEAEIIFDPRTSMPDARSIIVLGMRYLLEERHIEGVPSDPNGRIGREYWREFYPELKRMRLEMMSFLRSKGAAVVEENRVPTKAAAYRSGIGVYGKNSIIQNEDLGSWVIYTAIITDLELVPDGQEEPRCGSCQRCIRLCPAKAIPEPFVLDASRCLILIMASPGPIPMDMREAMGDMVNSCNVCQEVCPRNENVVPVKSLLKDRFGKWSKSPKLLDILDMTEGEFKDNFADLEWTTPQLRSMKRNALVALGNRGDLSVLPRLQMFIDGDDELLSEHARWAKDNIQKKMGSG